MCSCSVEDAELRIASTIVSGLGLNAVVGVYKETECSRGNNVWWDQEAARIKFIQYMPLFL